LTEIKENFLFLSFSDPKIGRERERREKKELYKAT